MQRTDRVIMIMKRIIDFIIIEYKSIVLFFFCTSLIGYFVSTHMRSLFVPSKHYCHFPILVAISKSNGIVEVLNNWNYNKQE